MLYLYTDIQDQEWLKYILEEFCRISAADFEIILTDKLSEDNTPTLIYTATSDAHIYQNSSSNIEGDVEFIREDFFVLGGTYSNASFPISYDLFFNAFYFLSRKGEYDKEKIGIKVQSYSRKSGREDKRTWLIPIVNYYFQELKQFIQENFPSLKFNDPQEPVLVLSHDLDYLNKTLSLRIKQSAFRIYNAIRHLSPRQIWNGTKFFFTFQDYWYFDYWASFEEAQNMRSTFFIYTKKKNKGIITWLFDPAYDISKNKKLQDKLNELKNRGFNIGLHGSFKSASNMDLMKEEKRLLEESLGFEVRTVRQHWLRYQENITPQIHEQLFEEDATLGWNDQIGFRSGIASKYRHFNHSENRPFNHFEIPQVIMDSHIFDYGFNNQESIIQQCHEILKTCKQIPNSHISISWHPRTYNKEYGWHKVYEKLVEFWRTVT